MKKSVSIAFQISAVFIGTIVGAGLASGQEICQFFTVYGYKSFLGILVCSLIYIAVGYMIISLSLKYHLNSYNELINLVSPGFIGKITDIITGMFLISSAAIILAGSGALLHQYFGISKWIGILIMAAVSIFTLLKDTKGLITINSFIVPSLIIVIVTIFILYLMFNKNIVSVTYIRAIPYNKNYWLLSTFLYGGFNILCCSGVLVPLSLEFKNKKALVYGVILGALGLTLLSLMINLLLLLNVPYIFKYEIPLLYIANRFGKPIQLMLLIIILCEMFSTEVSDIYSVGKTLEHAFKISYKKAVILIAIIALPISQIGFVKLITILYPSFGAVSLVFMLQCSYFYLKQR